MKPTLTLLVAMLVAGGAQASDVFKTTDSKGQPVYTDRPATLPAERLDVRTQTTDKVEVQQRYDEQMKNYAETEKAQATQNAAAKDAAQAGELSATAKAKRCDEARHRYESYMNARRLYEPGESENDRRYLTDEEIDAAREKAQQVMNTFCNEG
jgi:hypothetical protein